MLEIVLNWMDYGGITLASGATAVSAVMYILFKIESKPNKKK